MFRVWLVNERQYLPKVFGSFAEAYEYGREANKDFSILKRDSGGTYRTLGWCCGQVKSWKDLGGPDIEPSVGAVA